MTHLQKQARTRGGRLTLQSPSLDLSREVHDDSVTVVDQHDDSDPVKPDPAAVPKLPPKLPADHLLRLGPGQLITKIPAVLTPCEGVAGIASGLSDRVATLSPGLRVLDCPKALPPLCTAAGVTRL